MTIAAQFLRCRGTFFFCYSGTIFERPRSLSIDYSGAKYTRFPPKIAAIQKALFRAVENGKFLNRLRNGHLEKSATAGHMPSRSPKTAKTPRKVHLRLRSENREKSPALRGLFVAERAPIRGTSLYLVLKSNGLHRPKIRLKSSVFAQNRSRNYRQKLPLQLRPKPLFIAFFSLSHKRPTFAFTGESGYTLGFRRRIAHSGLHAETGGVSDGGGIHYSWSVPHVHQHPGPGIRTASFAAFGAWSGCSQRTQKAFGTAMRLCASLFRGVAAPLGCVICLQLGDVAVFSLCAQYFLNVRGGGGITTLGAFHTFRKPCVARGRTANFADFEPWPVCARRTQKAFGTACASLFRGVAARWAA